MRKAIIIHDNNKEVVLLQDYLKMVPGILVAGIFTTLDDTTLNAINELECDMVFSSLSVLIKLINSQTDLPLLICMGPNEEMLSAAISKNIFAFINTPFSYERVLSLIQTAETYMLQLSATATIKRDYVFVKSDYKLIRINLSDILFLSGLRDYTQIFLKGKTSPLTTLQNLKEFESKLPETIFVRVHRSYIISLSQVDSISRNEISIGTHTIPIGNAYRQLLDDMITKNS
jgi:DNA-binding LytR/AlgR family response regulator